MIGKLAVAGFVRAAIFPFSAGMQEVTWCSFGNNLLKLSVFSKQLMDFSLCLLHTKEKDFKKAVEQKIGSECVSIL